MVWRITTDELLARYKAGERNFAGIELIRIVGEMCERDGISGLRVAMRGIINHSILSYVYLPYTRPPYNDLKSVHNTIN